MLFYINQIIFISSLFILFGSILVFLISIYCSKISKYREIVKATSSIKLMKPMKIIIMNVGIVIIIIILVGTHQQRVSDNNELEVENNYIPYEEYSNLKQSYDELNNEYESLVENYYISIRENLYLQKSYDELEDQYQYLKEQIILVSKVNESLQNKVSNDNQHSENIDMSAPEIEKVSIFDLDTFQGNSHWISQEELIDTYGNEYPNGYYTFHRTERDDNPTYLLDYKYSKCEGKIAWSKDDKNISGRCWIDFYDGDTLIYSTDPISASDRPLSFEFSVENVETLEIVCNSSCSYGSVTIIYEYLDLIP